MIGIISTQCLKVQNFYQNQQNQKNQQNQQTHNNDHSSPNEKNRKDKLIEKLVSQHGQYRPFN